MNALSIAQNPTDTSKPNGEIINFSSIKKENEYSYTPLPNFLIDEGYFAVLPDTAVTILTVMNRHTKGFHKQSKSLSIDTIKSLCGIKDDRTARKFLNELKKYGLLKVSERKGTTSIYTLTFDARLPLEKKEKKAKSIPPAYLAPLTYFAPTPPTYFAGTTPYILCTPLKEISLKENIKEKNKRDWLVFENLKSEIESVNNSIDFNEIKNASWFERELKAFENFNADKNHNTDVMIYLFANWLIKAYCKAQSVNNQMQYKNKKQPSEKQGSSEKPKQPNTVTADQEQQASEKRKTTSPLLNIKQIGLFARRLANHDPFASQHANVGEEVPALAKRLQIKLGNPDYVQEIMPWLKAVGYGQQGANA